MANLTVKPILTPIKVEAFNNISVERAANNFDCKVVSKSSLFGAPLTTYASAKSDARHAIWDNFLNPDHRPYVVAVTCLVESPMKLFIYN
jgi:hypothetical protein